MTQAQICEIDLKLFTNHFEDICNDYFIILFMQKRAFGQWVKEYLMLQRG
jgi:hypothetical protein